MTTVYIQKTDKGEWVSENAFSAVRGFEARGDEVRPFTAKELEAGALPLSRETIVHGGLQMVGAALKILGVKYPRFETYPHVLRHAFMDRTPTEIQVGTVHHAVQEPGWKPAFIKPSRDHKLFVGLVVSKYSDLLEITHVPEETWVWKSPVVRFLSEYRIFMLRGEMIGMRHYRGDPLVFPDVEFVRKLIKASKVMPQAAFSLDVGVALFPERPEKIRTPTLLVEANDGHSLGSYGLASTLYAQMIEARWNQMVAGQ